MAQRSWMPISTITRIVPTAIRDCCGKKAISACKATMAALNSAICMSSRCNAEPRVARSGDRATRVPFPSSRPVPLEPHLAADKHGLCPPVDLPSAKGAVPALGAELTRIDRPGYVGIDHCHVGHGTRLKGAAVDPEHAGRIDRELLYQLRPGKMARLNEAENANGQQRLHADDAVGGFRQLAHFLFWSVRSVVARDDFQGAVLETADEGLHVALGSQRRSHLVIAIEGLQALVREGKMMRTRFPAHPHAAL